MIRLRVQMLKSISVYRGFYRDAACLYVATSMDAIRPVDLWLPDRIGLTEFQWPEDALIVMCGERGGELETVK